MTDTTLKLILLGEDQSASDALEGVGAQADSSTGRVGSALATMGAAFLAAGGFAVATGVQTAAGMETAEIAFSTMLGSGERAKAFLGELSDFAASTPFELPQLQAASQSLISIGIDADRVIPIMTTLGNVTSGMGTGAEGIQRATVALQQMNAAGRISAEDLAQLRDAGVPVYDLLAAATGKSVEEVAKLAQQGKLGREELTQLMSALESGAGLERFNGMMEAQSQSLSGLWSTLKDTFAVGMADLIEPLIPLIKDGLTAAISALSSVLPQAKEWIQGFVDSLTQMSAGGSGDALKAALSSIGQGVTDMVSALPAFTPLLESAGDALGFVADHADILGAALPYLAAAFLAVKAANTVFGGDSAAGMATRLASTVALTASNFALAASNRSVAAAEATATAARNGGILSTMRATAASMAHRVGELAGAAARGVVTAAQWLLNAAMSANPIMLIVLAIAALVAGLVYAYQHSETFRAIVDRVWAAVKNAIGTVVDWLIVNVPKAFAFVKNAFLTYTPLGLVISHWDGIKAAVFAVVDWFSSAIPAALQWVKDAFLSYTPLGLVISHWDGIKAAVFAVVDWF